jgi:formylglycine-generating enzyme required for sulfatase activity
VTPPTPVQPSVGVFPSSRAAKPLTPGEERALKPKDAFKECDACPEMVVVPAGSFTMGSPESEAQRGSDEGPQRRVTFTRQFAVGKFSVTFDEWDACVADGGCNRYRPLDQGWGRDRRPVINVSWDDAQAYVAWLSRKTGKTYRLLSEAEWEYAARARTQPDVYRPYWFGKEEKDLCQYGNGADQEAKSKISGASGWTIAPCNDGHAYTAPAGSFPANEFGLYDMAGNAWQWTADCWNESYKAAPSDGSALVAGDCGRRVLRGGSWINNPKVLRAANRDHNVAGLRYCFNGFRLGRTLAP